VFELFCNQNIVLKRNGFNIILFLLISLDSSGQALFQHDTVNIQEVVIRGKKSGTDAAGYKICGIDTSVMKMCSQYSLADLLSQHTSVFIKSYGMGGTATPSFRGTGAGHTQLTWNGINLNNPMLGQSDLSLVPAGLIDAIQIFYGGASIASGNGGIGGTINIATNPVWQKETRITFSPAAASFGQFSSLVKVSTGSTRFQSVTKVFYQHGENNFPFLNSVSTSDPVWEKRRNSQVEQKGMIQEVYFRNDKSVTSARVWYQASDRNLPSSMLVQQPGLKETQFDESLRTLMNYGHTGTNGVLNISGAWIMNRLDYTNSLAQIDSRNRSQTFVLKSGFEKAIGASLKMKFSLDDNVNFINSNNYDGKRSRNNISLTATAENKFGNRFNGSVLVRETADRNKLLSPDFSTGLQFRPIVGKDYFLKANISRNSRIPSLNDLFWLPGGNPDLKNEYAFIYELSAEINRKFSHPVELKAVMTLFRNEIKDMIQWHPGEFSYWSADNIKSVNTSGIESSVNLNYSTGRFRAELLSNYSYTRATTVESGTANDGSVGKQLIYMPVHQANLTATAGYGRIYASWIFIFTGKRYITSDNSSSLPAYLLNNTAAGTKFNFRETLLDVRFQIDNIFNVNYQAIAYYPMPGRSYSLKLLLQFHK